MSFKEMSPWIGTGLLSSVVGLATFELVDTWIGSLVDLAIAVSSLVGSAARIVAFLT